MKKSVKVGVAALLLAALVGGNWAADYFETSITALLCGTGESFENAKLTLEQSDKLCRKVGDESIVLLKNENETLPMKDLTQVNVFGWGGSDEGFLLKGVGSGSSTISAKKSVSLLQAFEAAGIACNPDLVNFYKNWGTSNRNSLRRNSALSTSNAYKLAEPAVGDLEALISDAQAYSDTAIFVLSRCGGENMGDLPAGYLDITASEQATLDLLTQNFDKVVVLLNTTNTMHAGFLDDSGVDAAMYVGITGQSAAAAIPRILKGLVNPSGKLADTMPYGDAYDPTYANIAMGSNQYAESIYYGYKWYETADVEGYFDGVSNEYGDGYDGVVQYSFGYGLSYTDFEWEVDSLYTLNEAGEKQVLDHTKAIIADGIDPSEKIYLDVIVENGDVKGKDVVELYFTPEYISGEVEKAHVNLLDFAKTPELEAEASSKVTMSFTLYDMASYDCYDKNENGSAVWELDSGDYTLKLMTDSHHAKDCEYNEIVFQVNNDIIIDKDTTTGTDVENRFTGEGAYLGLQIDAIAYGGATYMTRADFEGTFPKTTAPKPNASIINEADNAYYDKPYLALPEIKTGQDNGLYLATFGGSKATLNQLNGKDLDGATLEWNYELMEDLINYDSDTWNDLLDQMTAEEIKNLIELGGFRRLAVESVGKPLQMDYDGPAGFNTNTLTGSFGGEAVDTESWTAYPSEALIGCSWNKDLMFEMGRSMGAEADKTAIDGWYAPGVNLHRNAYLGRNFEYYSEDGVLSGKLAANVVYGAKTNGLICYVKHFVASDSGSNPRDTDTWMTEQCLRENVLKPFEIVVKEGGANAMMSAFNDLGSVWCGANYALLTEVLRDEWGFRGVVLTDWCSGGNRGGMSLRQGIRAGNDIWLNPYTTLSGDNLNTSDATDMKAARIAAKNVLYALVDAEYEAEQYRQMSVDDIYQTSGSIGFKEEVFAWWKPVVIGIDVLGAIAILVLLFSKSKAEKEAKNAKKNGNKSSKNGKTASKKGGKKKAKR